MGDWNVCTTVGSSRARENVSRYLRFVLAYVDLVLLFQEMDIPHSPLMKMMVTFLY